MEQIFHVGVKALIRDGPGVLVTKGRSARYWDLPGGRIEEGEGIRDALLRELEEELGISEIEILDFYDAVISKTRIDTDRGVVGLCVLVYNCKFLNANVKLSSTTEHDEYKWARGKELVDLLGNKFPLEFLEILQE